MNREPSAQPESTVAQLHDALEHGIPVMIPGAREPRHAVPAPPRAYTAVPPIFDRRRLEHEWEGGGAPEARGGGRRGMAAWLWRVVRRPDRVTPV